MMRSLATISLKTVSLPNVVSGGNGLFAADDAERAFLRAALAEIEFVACGCPSLRLRRTRRAWRLGSDQAAKTRCGEAL